ncbi:MAG: SIR2 family protein [Bacteroidales bacterium]|nr:SIR2 family protein [Bacteroidales bacterium]
MGKHKISDNYLLSFDAFLRSIDINKNISHSFFLGAGASISSGIMSAEMCIRLWKREVFLSQNSGFDRKLFDISLPSVMKRIQKWLDEQGSYPALDASDEYGFYAKKSFPITDDRRKFFQNLTTKKRPHIGYQYLALLGKLGLISSIWSTNFDGLAAKALIAEGIDVVEVGLDTTSRVIRPLNAGEVFTVSLHGDYRYDALKNTNEELQSQDDTLRNALIGNLKNTSIIVSGYSGRDESIMSVFKEGFSQPGSGRLYWCGYDSYEPDERVDKLINQIRDAGREAFYIPTLGFDDLAERIALHTLEGELLECAKKIRENNLSHSEDFIPFSITTNKTIGLIKSNAFEIELPTDIFQFKIKDYGGDRFWNWLRGITEGKNIVAAPLKGHIMAFGMVQEIQDVFSEYLVGKITRVPIDNKELIYDDSVIKSLIISALVKGLSAKGLNSNGQSLIWKATSKSNRMIKGVNVGVFDAVNLSLKSYRDNLYLVLKPTIEGRNLDGTPINREINQELRRLLLTKQYNAQFNDALDEWRKILFPDNRTTLAYPNEQEDAFKFNICSAPIFAEIGSNGHESPISLPKPILRYVKQKGIQLDEPFLVFSNNQADGFVQDSHQLRGILRNQPFDYGLTKSGMLPTVSVGVICPVNHSQKFSRYLTTLHQQVKVDSKQEYLLDYPGFSQAFGLPLNLPEPNQNGWHYCGVPEAQADVKSGANFLRNEIIKNIESLASSINPNVIIVYVPNSWNAWEAYEGSGESFDLHDFVKAYCVQKGISTQFIREETLSKSYKCEIVWWLAQSLYTKAMRTPWVLKEIDDETAFVGFGYGLNYSQGKGNHVILGCSHIYGSNGQGLKYKLSKIENPIIRRKNPFMSKDDTRRVGDSILQMFFESFHKLPQRVVIHKRNYYTKDEKEGLSESLGSVAAVDMLEIQFDPMLRYVASRIQNGNFSGDGFPVRRGTALILGSQKAALWVHGTADAVTSGRRYYQGKSRIPAPLVITRHYGNSSLQTLATEVLGLSKMNWNNFDLYSKLPATIESSRAIAKIGLLLDRFNNYSYDYRLFF